ncbi:MAG: GNAT family N-acetyltransferase [Lachnospiraceae bacterium]|nr:GNAT family N-acetyltransferase [Lachnospiraceae bacterium]
MRKGILIEKIGKLMVHPKMQKQGIGTQLLLAMEKEFQDCRYELFTSTKSITLQLTLTQYFTKTIYG